MYIMLIFSYLALAIAVTCISLTVAYGAWESIGLILVVVFSNLIFSEPWSLAKVIAVLLIFLGMLLLTKGTSITQKKK